MPLIGNAVEWVRENASVSVGAVQGWVSDSVQTLLKSAAAMGGNVALGVFGTLVGFFMMLFMLFFFLQDGRAMIAGLERLIPVERERRAQLLKYLGRGHARGGVRLGRHRAGAGRVRRHRLCDRGAALAGGVRRAGHDRRLPARRRGPRADPGGAVPGLQRALGRGHLPGLLDRGVWPCSENVLRPLLTAHHAEVSTLAIFIGAIGGAAAFGILGLIIGPVLLSFVVALVRFAQEGLPADA